MEFAKSTSTALATTVSASTCMTSPRPFLAEIMCKPITALKETCAITYTLWVIIKDSQNPALWFVRISERPVTVPMETAVPTSTRKWYAEITKEDFVKMEETARTFTNSRSLVEIIWLVFVQKDQTVPLHTPKCSLISTSIL